MSGLRRMSLGASIPEVPNYEQICEQWHNRRDKGSPFRGHFLYSFVAESYQIENINVDYNTTKELFESGKVTDYTGDLRDAFSVLNNSQVAAYINTLLHNQKQLSPEIILEVHRLLMFGSMDKHRYEDNGERAGTYKQKDYCVGKLSVGASPEDVPGAIQELCTMCNSIMNKDPLKVATVFQCHFEYIHPFADGNGRVGRWLVNYLLALCDHPPVLFERAERKSYYRALESFDATEDYNLMYAFLREQACSSFSALREFL